MSFNARWETDIYAQGRQMNRFPHHGVVSHVLRFSAGVQNRADVRILDIGCGAGNNLFFLAQEGFQTYGIDGSSSAISFAKSRLATARLEADVRVGDFATLPWPANHFDLVIDRCALSHCRRATIEAALDEIVRTLKPGGELYSELWSDIHYERAFGSSLGDGAFDTFSEGTFKPIGTTFFASSRDIDEFFSSRFNVISKNHLACEHMIEKLTSGSWSIVCRKHLEA